MDKIGIFRFNGCDKCFNETVLLHLRQYEVSRYYNFEDWDGCNCAVAVITGYITPEDENKIKKIAEKSERVIAFGSCATSGGIFGLMYQHGKIVLPSRIYAPDAVKVHGCLGDIDLLTDAILGRETKKESGLCKVCGRRSTCTFLTEVIRQPDPDDKESCFNDMGLMCSGYVSEVCAERCIDFDVPCRGCMPKVDRASIRMLGMFGTLMGNMDVATENCPKGATDKLADKEDEITRSLPDIVGNFFRYSLADSPLPPGKVPSTGSTVGDIMTGRLIEEAPYIMASIGGRKFISLTLDMLEAYEKGTGIEIGAITEKLRETLRRLEKEYGEAVSSGNKKDYDRIRRSIVEIAGNMNLSNLYYGGFRRPIRGYENFEDYRYKNIEFKAGTYSSGAVTFTVDDKGIIKEFKAEGFD